MHIEIFETKAQKMQPWNWHKVNQGKITCHGEGHSSHADALRAAKADVRQTIKSYTKRIKEHMPAVVFTLERDVKRLAVTILKWSA
jgi:hypothetical protein